MRNVSDVVLFIRVIIGRCKLVIMTAALEALVYVSGPCLKKKRIGMPYTARSSVLIKVWHFVVVRTMLFDSICVTVPIFESLCNIMDSLPDASAAERGQHLFSLPRSGKGI
jgi:hypothetical protein